MTTLTPDQLQDLREEFIEFKINEMTSEDMASYIRDIMLHDVNVLNKEELEYEINSYDENLYEILEDYVLDVPLHRSSYYKYCRSEFFCTLSLPLEKSSVDFCVL